MAHRGHGLRCNECLLAESKRPLQAAIWGGRIYPCGSKRAFAPGPDRHIIPGYVHVSHTALVRWPIKGVLHHLEPQLKYWPTLVAATACLPHLMRAPAARAEVKTLSQGCTVRRYGAPASSKPAAFHRCPLAGSEMNLMNARAAS